VEAFVFLLALMLITCGTKGPVMTAKQTPWMRPCRAAFRLQVGQLVIQQVECR